MLYENFHKYFIKRRTAEKESHIERTNLMNALALLVDKCVKYLLLTKILEIFGPSQCVSNKMNQQRTLGCSGIQMF